jgi:AbrB family looped-hinge helix DNA binding protein
MRTTVSSKGQVVLPAELRQQDRIQPGQQFEVERLQAGEYLLKKLSGPGQPGLLDWLRQCPAQDWFRPLPAESTDTL